MSQSSHDDHSPTHYFTTPEGPTRTRTIAVNVWDDSMTCLLYTSDAADE